MGIKPKEFRSMVEEEALFEWSQFVAVALSTKFCQRDRMGTIAEEENEDFSDGARTPSLNSPLDNVADEEELDDHYKPSVVSREDEDIDEHSEEHKLSLELLRAEVSDVRPDDD